MSTIMARLSATRGFLCQHSIGEKRTYIRLVSLGFVVLFCLLIVLGMQSYVPLVYLTSDPAVLSQQPFYFGMLSNIGVLLWIATATVCLFSALLLKILKRHTKSATFLSVFGIISLFLGLDDLFLLHERAIPKVFHVSQTFVLASYAIIVSVCLLRFRHHLLKNHPFLFAVSLLFFSISILADVLPIASVFSLAEVADKGIHSNSLHLIEDGSKLLGIFLWLAHFSGVAVIPIVEAAVEGSPELPRQ